MGLDITVYKNLKVVENPTLDEYGDPVNWQSEWMPGGSMDWSESAFPGRGEGIDSKTTYSWEEEFDFRAGSYSGYNWWRTALERFAEGGQFEELINFADNEGVIGPVVSKKLAKDFAENKERAKAFSETLDEGSWWFEKYNDWHKAFEMASHNGAVNFH